MNILIPSLAWSHRAYNALRQDLSPETREQINSIVDTATSYIQTQEGKQSANISLYGSIAGLIHVPETTPQQQEQLNQSLERTRIAFSNHHRINNEETERERRTLYESAQMMPRLIDDRTLFNYNQNPLPPPTRLPQPPTPQSPTPSQHQTRTRLNNPIVQPRPNLAIWLLSDGPGRLCHNLYLCPSSSINAVKSMELQLQKHNDDKEIYKSILIALDSLRKAAENEKREYAQFGWNPNPLGIATNHNINPSVPYQPPQTGHVGHHIR